MMNEIEQLQIRCVSHEIRNQISVCEMYSEIIKKYMVKDNYENASVDSALECIQKSVKMISNSLLDLKSINKTELVVCDVNSLIEEACNLSRAYSFGKNITIDIKLCNSVNIYVDEVKFIACIVNIIKNACEAIEDSGAIKILSKRFTDNICIFISNNGKQIPEETQKSIFEEGYTTKSYGSGLGLHICKNNLKIFNSELRLNHSNSESTEFEIVVPIYTSL